MMKLRGRSWYQIGDRREGGERRRPEGHPVPGALLGSRAARLLVVMKRIPD